MMTEKELDTYRQLIATEDRACDALIRAKRAGRSSQHELEALEAAVVATARFTAAFSEEEETEAAVLLDNGS